MPMYLVWHVKHQAEPMHAWLRQELEAVVPAVLGSTPVPGPDLG
jgi:hypothetical protein